MVQFYGAATSSTQGVESQFSELERQNAPRVAQQMVLRTRDRVEISHMDETELIQNGAVQPLLQNAMKQYLHFFGKARRPYGHPELGTRARGVPRGPKKSKLKSEASLLKQQRQATRHLSSKTGSKTGSSRTMFGKKLPGAIACWSEKHAALHQALEAKRSAKVLEALETRGQGLRPGTTAALKTRKLLNGPFAGLTARKRRLKAMLEAPQKCLR